SRGSATIQELCRFKSSKDQVHPVCRGLSPLMYTNSCHPYSTLGGPTSQDLDFEMRLWFRHCSRVSARGSCAVCLDPSVEEVEPLRGGAWQEVIRFWGHHLQKRLRQTPVGS
ncbi:hypothetical protein H1C71_007329, partial [Ictidomys tridecemlineatus]